MKKFILNAAMFIMAIFIGIMPSTEIKAQTNDEISLNVENFPDAWVLNLAKEYDKDGSGTLSQEEINEIKKISGNGLVTSFSEFEYFINLKELKLGTEKNSCSISGTLDFTKFQKMENLVIYRRGTDIDIKVAGLKNLKQLIIYNETPNEESDEIGNIDLHDTPALEVVDIESAGKVSFDNQTAIRKLRLKNAGASIQTGDTFPLLEELDTNSISRSVKTIDFSMCSNLKKLVIDVNSLETIVLSASLEKLDIQAEQLKNIDLSVAEKLQELYLQCEKLKIPDLSKNQKLVDLSLKCIMTDSVNFDGNKNLETLYIDNCGNYAKGTKQTIGLGNNKKLKTLELRNLTIQALNVSKLTNLKKLVLWNAQQLVSINFPASNNLYSIDLTDTGIKKLSLVKAKKLKELQLIDNYKLLQLDISKNTNLTKLELWRNKKLSNLNLANNRRLVTLKLVQNNSIKKLDLSKNEKLENLTLTGSGLKSVNLKNNKAIKHLELKLSKLCKLDLRNNKKITYLKIKNCPIKTIDLKNNKQLTYLRIENCKVTAVNLTKNKKLQTIIVRNNKLHTLSLGSKTKLERFYCNGNGLKTINLSGCKKGILKEIHCDKKVKVIGYTGKIVY